MKNNIHKTQHGSTTGELMQRGDKDPLNGSFFRRFRFISAIAARINKKASSWPICDDGKVCSSAEPTVAV